MLYELTQKVCIFCVTNAPNANTIARFLALTQRRMKHPTSQQKHDILIHCESRRTNETEVNVAASHGVITTRKTIWKWRLQWNRTPQSLERKDGSGRVPLLTPTEISRHIRAPLLAANRSHRAINYTTLLPEVQRKTGKKIALRTLQDYGKQRLQAQFKHTRKRTADEGQYIYRDESE